MSLLEYEKMEELSSLYVYQLIFSNLMEFYLLLKANML